jgi:hypothetical protein
VDHVSPDKRERGRHCRDLQSSTSYFWSLEPRVGRALRFGKSTGFTFVASDSRRCAGNPGCQDYPYTNTGNQGDPCEAETKPSGFEFTIILEESGGKEAICKEICLMAWVDPRECHNLKSSDELCRDLCRDVCYSLTGGDSTRVKSGISRLLVLWIPSTCMPVRLPRSSHEKSMMNPACD